MYVIGLVIVLYPAYMCTWRKSHLCSSVYMHVYCCYMYMLLSLSDTHGNIFLRSRNIACALRGYMNCSLGCCYMLIIIKFDVNIHRPKRSRGNEKDKLPSRVEPRSNDQQISTLDTEPQPPDKSLSPHSIVVAQCLVCWFAGH